MGFLTRGSALGFVLIVASTALAQPWQAQFDLSATQLQEQIDALVPQGFRPAMITAHESPGGPRFQTAWVNDGMTNWGWISGATSADYGTFSTAQIGLGRRPLCVSAYGSFPNELYAAVWVNDGVTQWNAQRQMTAAMYDAQLLAMSGIGYRPYWVSTTGSGSNVRYAALWIGDSLPKCELHFMSSAQFSTTVVSYRSSGCRLLCSSGAGNPAAPTFAAVWVLWENPPWEAHTSQTLAELQVSAANHLSQGYRPSFVNAYETTGGTRYSSSWELVPQPNVFTKTGVDVPELAAFDTSLQDFMTARHIPNAILAVTKNSRLVLARGYTNAPVGWPISRPHSPFRMASLTKTLTGIGVIKLVEDGVIGIDQPISTILDTSAWVDPRINNVTVRHLLQHWGGWNNIAFDPMYYDFQIIAALGRPLPTTPQMIFDFMATQPMNFNPGSQFFYSIFGYNVLGLVMEAATGQSYEQWMRTNVFLPVGASSIRTVETLLGNQYPGEPPYWDSYQRRSTSVMGPTSPAITPIQYGGSNYNSFRSTAGQVGSAIDYARVIAAFDNPVASPLLTQGSIDLMWSRPPGTPANASSWYAAGWLIQPLGTTGLIRGSGSGSMQGSTSWFMRRPDGVNWVVMFNSSGAPGTPSMSDMGDVIDGAANSITNWPSHDLFPNYALPSADTFVNVLLGIDTDPIHIEVSDANFDGVADARDVGPYMRQALP